MSQLSFFAADVQPPDVADLEGLLAGPGQVVTREDGSARVSVVVDDVWRVQPLLDAIRATGAAADAEPTGEGGTTVRTAWSDELADLAARWRSGAAKRPAPGFALDGPRLRLWCLAAGHPDPLGYLLRLGPHDDLAWPLVGAALAAAGLPATFLGPRGSGPAYRVGGQRRLSRLAELVGPRPEGVPERAWPASGVPPRAGE